MPRRLFVKQFAVSRNPQTTLRINRIDLLCPLEEAKDRVGFETRDDSPVFKWYMERVAIKTQFEKYIYWAKQWSLVMGTASLLRMYGTFYGLQSEEFYL